MYKILLQTDTHKQSIIIIIHTLWSLLHYGMKFCTYKYIIRRGGHMLSLIQLEVVLLLLTVDKPLLWGGTSSIEEVGWRSGPQPLQGLDWPPNSASLSVGMTIVGWYKTFVINKPHRIYKKVMYVYCASRLWRILICLYWNIELIRQLYTIVIVIEMWLYNNLPYSVLK